MDAHPLFSSSIDNEVCSSCGNFAVLNPITGWCDECTPPNLRIKVRSLSRNKTEISLNANANAVEFYLNNGTANNVWQALTLARVDRPTCIVCGERIKRAQRTAIFCRQHEQCRRYSRRYVYLYREKGMTKVEALALIFSELTGD